MVWIAINLPNCRLQGELPIGIFHLPNLQVLDVSYNSNLSCYLPVDISSPLERLYMVAANLSGRIPSSLEKLANLTRLYLPYNNLEGEIPPSLANLTRLVYLSLDENLLTGTIPFGLMALPKLVSLDLAHNQLTGPIPSVLIVNQLSELSQLDLSSNKLQGPIPASLFQLERLQSLHLGSNNLTGTVQLDKFFSLENLTDLDLSFNSLSLLTETNMFNIATSPRFQQLFLASCNFSHFPEFLRRQDDLQVLDLSSNKIRGEIPQWVLNISTQNLQHMNISNNFLTGFEKYPVAFSWTSLNTLDLSSNLLQGPLPIPPISMNFYLVSRNKLNGEIPATICELISLQALDLSFNNLSGMLPGCLGSFSSSLMVLNLRQNNFHGSIPQDFLSENGLKMIDFSENRLEGKLPRSLANCTQLEFLALANNQVNDTFPTWLGSLRELSVLILRSNRFHGVIGEPINNSEFPKLRIIDLSGNMFTGKLPSNYFRLWQAMEVVHHTGQAEYMELYLFGFSHAYSYYSYSFSMLTKGTELAYPKILDILVTIDLSANKFEGEIPEVIGNLKGLHSLNVSNNILTGHIPTSLGNLEELESLDLSNNQLSGEIPHHLAQLSFLAVFNVSNNQLTGPVPQGKQFDTFQDSYQGNPGLCGDLLSKNCTSSDTTPSTSDDQDSDDSSIEFDWKIIMAGYGGGLVVGVVLGNTFTSKKYDWFAKWTQGRRQRRSWRGRTRK